MFTHYHFTQIDSTNALARKWIHSGSLQAQLPVFITADRQTKGQGTKGRTWASDDIGGLYFSAILPESRFPVEEVTIVAQHIQTVVKRLANIELEIEWPNDLIFGDKKIAGILLERVRPSIIVGIGLNINQQQFPEFLAPVATSLFQITGHTYSKTAFSLELSKELWDEVSRH